MQQQIESLIFSNVGNRLTQELAIGLVMSLVQVTQKVINDAVVAASPPPGEPAPGVGQITPAANVDPAYQRDSAPARPVRKAAARPQGGASTKTKKARQ